MRNHWGKSLATFDGQIINDIYEKETTNFEKQTICKV